MSPRVWIWQPRWARSKNIGINRLMVEGGGTLNFALLRLGLVDELTAYVAPMVFGGETAPTLAGGPGLASSCCDPAKTGQRRGVAGWWGSITLHSGESRSRLKFVTHRRST